MSDRELLELAAKAAGIDAHVTEWSSTVEDDEGDYLKPWNPITDDGDALRLAVKLGLTVTPNYHVEQRSLGVIVFTELADSEDSCTATRRAIVRAAAEIGRNIK
ncbi:MAG: hypothetical protein IOD05_07385 [Rhodobacter sp.]|nr:hypothetical protein [Rhodobacter sp.]